MEEIAKRFNAMAERIAKNEGESFGGAFLIYPPDGEPVEVMILDKDQSSGQFWGLIQAKASLEVNRLQEQEVTSRAFGRR